MSYDFEGDQSDNSEYGYYEQVPDRQASNAAMFPRHKTIELPYDVHKQRIIMIGALAGFMLLLIGGVIVVIDHLIQWSWSLIALAWAAGFSAIPLLGVGFGVVALLRYFHKPYINPVLTPGTTYHDSLGGMMLISQQPMEAVEKERTRYQLPQPQQRTVPFIAVSNSEQVYEGPQQVFMPTPQFMEEEEQVQYQQAQEVVATVQERQTIERIQAMRSAGMPLRDIAIQVKMSGARYKRFQSLCEKAGINTRNEV